MAYEPPAGILLSAVAEGEGLDEFFPDRLADVDELAAERAGPTLVPVGIVRAADPETHSTFQSMLNAWVWPEVTRRLQAGAARDELVPLQRALIVFPPREDAARHRVLLNDEVRAGAVVRPAYPSALGTGPGEVTPVGLRDFFDLREFTLEGVDVTADGFAWMRPEAGGWVLYFNFLPTSGFAGDLTGEARPRVMRAVQDAVAQEVLREVVHGVFTDDAAVRAAMAADGWCPTPILLPDPWRAMCDAYRRGDSAAAETAALAAVGPAELDLLLGSWVAEEPFASDRRFLETGVERYKAGDYISAVSVLLPRIEGLANRVRGKRGIGAETSVAKVFASLDALASADLRHGYVATRIRDEFGAFVTSFLMTFFDPRAPDAGTMRGRHAHAHGATGEPHYDRAYALKIILALDALHLIAR